VAITPEETLADEASSPEETLAAEARRSTKAGAAAIAAGVLTFLGSVLALAANKDFPTEHLLDALRANLGSAPDGGPGFVARKVLFFDDNLLAILGARLIPALATALAAAALAALYLSTRARNPRASKLPLIAAIAGSVLCVVASVAGAVALASDVSGFAGAAQQTEQAARDALRSSFTQTAFALAALGSFIVGLSFVLTSLNAMRVGLLTRFMGVLGIIVGVLFLLPLDGQLPFVKIFWLIALGVLLLGRWPRGMPPAWVTGEAQPWPSQQEIREARAEAQAQRLGDGSDETARRPRRGRAEPPETPAPEPPPRTRAHSSSKKKKRKRR
jgi:hypothetical protein